MIKSSSDKSLTESRSVHLNVNLVMEWQSAVMKYVPS